MKVMKFWSDLNMWNKYGLCAVGAVVLIVVALFLL